MTQPPPPKHLSAEPQVLWGCTAPELYRLFLYAFLFWGLVTFFVIAAFGIWFIWFPLTGVLTFVSAWLGGKRLRRLKRGKPEQFFHQQTVLWMQRWGLRSQVFNRQSGPWSLGRTRRVLP